MSLIRPLEPSDLPAVASLYERVMRPGSEVVAPSLEGNLRALLVEHPWVDPEIPSLVYEDEHGITGFNGSHVRRLHLGGRPLRAAYSGQFVVAPEARTAAPGVLLSARYLAGPQDLTLTDGANDSTVRIWGACGAERLPLASLEWTWVLRPGGYAVEMLGRRLPGRRSLATLRRGTLGLDAAVRRSKFKPPPSLEAGRFVAEDLTAELVLRHLEGLVGGFELGPAYDRQFLEWLLGQLASIKRRGRLLARMLLRRDGRPVGWHISYAPAGGIAQVIQIAAARAEVPTVVQDLLDQTYRAGAVAVSGRLEPALLDTVAHAQCFIRRGSAALIHAREPRTVEKVLAGRAFLTRLEGEWWMEPHLL